jgi:hypothetical protein
MTPSASCEGSMLAVKPRDNTRTRIVEERDIMIGLTATSFLILVVPVIVFGPVSATIYDVVYLIRVLGSPLFGDVVITLALLGVLVLLSTVLAILAKWLKA